MYTRFRNFQTFLYIFLKGGDEVKKFYNIKSKNNVTGVYIYGEIIGGTEKWDESDVTFDDFRTTLDVMNNGDT